MSARFICGDALEYLRENVNVGSVVTSLPDAHEMNITLEDWAQWFRSAAAHCIRATSANCCTIFYQTDRRAQGEQHSKALLLFEAAQTLNARCLWHKIVLRHAVEQIDLFRPSFSHLICFSRKMRVGTPTADVIEASKQLWRYGVGVRTARFCAQYVKRADNRLLDPFCGFGTFVIAAHEIGMDAVGVDIDKNRIAICESALSQGLLKFKQ